MKRLIDIQMCNGENFDIHAESLSAIQKSKSKTTFIDFDIDSENAEHEVFDKIDYTKINRDAVHFLKTRGGMHILIETAKVDNKFSKTWYQYFTNTFTIDVKGDCMIPVPGTYQGGFTPRFINTDNEINPNNI